MKEITRIHLAKTPFSVEVDAKKSLEISDRAYVIEVGKIVKIIKIDSNKLEVEEV